MKRSENLYFITLLKNCRSSVGDFMEIIKSQNPTFVEISMRDERKLNLPERPFNENSIFLSWDRWCFKVCSEVVTRLKCIRRTIKTPPHWHMYTPLYSSSGDPTWKLNQIAEVSTALTANKIQQKVWFWLLMISIKSPTDDLQFFKSKIKYKVSERVNLYPSNDVFLVFTGHIKQNLWLLNLAIMFNRNYGIWYSVRVPKLYQKWKWRFFSKIYRIIKNGHSLMRNPPKWPVSDGVSKNNHPLTVR